LNGEQRNPGGLGTFEKGEVMLLFYMLCERYRRKALTLDDFLSALKDLMFYDFDGNLWTIGAGSGKWYCREGDRWVLGSPQGPLTKATQASLKYSPVEERREKSSGQELERAFNNPIMREFLRQARAL